MPRQWEVGNAKEPGDGWCNMRRTCCEEPGGDGFVILVIKDRVASMPGVRTECGKLPESLRRKAAPSLFYPFSRDLIIFSNSQDGIFVPSIPSPSPSLFLSLFISFYLALSLCLKPIWNSELTKKRLLEELTNGWTFLVKYKTLAFYSSTVPLLNVFRTIIVFVGLFAEHLPRDVNSYNSRDIFLLCPCCVYFIQILPISPLTFCSWLLQAVVLRWGTP